eukprot:NODE_292_length_10587_cov_0.520881.p4 type:complete len:340 gc:universal NODE_292_length_10587_cov_0.520881:4313-3294(-)
MASCLSRDMILDGATDIAIFGIELTGSLVSYLLLKENVSVTMLTNNTEYIEKRPLLMNCGSKWVDFIIEHKLQKDIEFLISQGIMINGIKMPMTKQDVFNSDFTLKEKRLIMKYMEYFIQDLAVDFELPTNLNSFLNIIKNDYLGFSKQSIEKAVAFQSQSPHLVNEYFLEAELTQLLTRKSAVLGGLQMMNSQVSSISSIDNEFHFKTQYGQFKSSKIVIDSSHIHLLPGNFVHKKKETVWYSIIVESDITASLEVQQVNDSILYGLNHDGKMYYLSNTLKAIDHLGNPDQIKVIEYECLMENVFVLPDIISVISISDEHFLIADTIVSKILERSLDK